MRGASYIFGPRLLLVMLLPSVASTPAESHESRAEPDPSLFTIPSDFRITEGPQKIVYRSNQ
jgi:hypothetical protein